MTLDPAPDPGQGRSPGARVSAWLWGPFLQARGRVNCDVMARRLSRRNLLILREQLVAGIELIDDITDLETTSDTAE